MRGGVPWRAKSLQGSPNISAVRQEEPTSLILNRDSLG